MIGGTEKYCNICKMFTWFWIVAKRTYQCRNCEQHQHTQQAKEQGNG